MSAGARCVTLATDNTSAKSSHKRGATSRRTAVLLVPTKLASDIAVSFLHAVVVPMAGNATISMSFPTPMMPYRTVRKTALQETSLLITETTWVVWAALTVKIAHYTWDGSRRRGQGLRLRRSSTATLRSGERLNEVGASLECVWRYADLH